MDERTQRLVAKPVELDDLRRWREVLLPVMAMAVIVQAAAYHRLITTNTGWIGYILSTAIGAFAVAWAGSAQRKIPRLEDELA